MPCVRKRQTYRILTIVPPQKKHQSVRLQRGKHFMLIETVSIDKIERTYCLEAPLWLRNLPGTVEDWDS